MAYGDAALNRLSDLIATIKGEDLLKPVTVIASRQYAGFSLRRLLSGATGLLNVRFMVIPKLAEYLGASKLAAEKNTPLCIWA